MKQNQVLLLNADYNPEKIIGWQKAIIQDVIKTKNSAYTVVYYDKWVILDGSGRKYPVPSVMALRHYIKIGDRDCPYTKCNVYARDLMVCQYCEQRFAKSDLTVDHVIPVSKWRQLGGKGSASCFENVVTACKRCNSIKGDKKLEDSGLYLLNKPRPLTRREAFSNKIALMESVPVEWEPYLVGLMSEAK